jgi:hypothetical protein
MKTKLKGACSVESASSRTDLKASCCYGVVFRDDCVLCFTHAYCADTEGPYTAHCAFELGERFGKVGVEVFVNYDICFRGIWALRG